MEMLKKLMIVLVITGSCAVQAMDQTQAMDQVQAIERDLHEKARAMHARMKISKDREMNNYGTSNRSRDIIVAVPKGGFASKTFDHMEHCYSYIYGVLSGGLPGYQNQKLLLKYNESLQQIEMLVDEALLLHVEIDDLLEQGAQKKNVFHQRPMATRTMINQDLKRLDEICDQMSAILNQFNLQEKKARQEEAKARKNAEDARFEAALNALKAMSPERKKELDRHWKEMNNKKNGRPADYDEENDARIHDFSSSAI